MKSKACQKAFVAMVLIGGVLLVPAAGRAQIVQIEMVSVGDPGNLSADGGESIEMRQFLRADGSVAAASESQAENGGGGFGSVDYVYSIGMYPVTVGEYTAFLNAVAAEDGWTDGSHLYYSGWAGVVIDQLGDPGAHTYAARTGTEGKPIHFVTWMNAVRFANWLHNGQPTGGRSVLTTERGSYDLSVSPPVRESEASWVIPTEDEWYKAAYFSPVKFGPGQSGYFRFATQSDLDPMAEAPPGGSNSANYANATLGFTDAGAYIGTRSYYGTMDQTGNIWEYLDKISDDCAWMRGGSYRSTSVGSSNAVSFFACVYELGLNTRTDTAGFRLVRLDPPGQTVAPSWSEASIGTTSGQLDDLYESDDQRYLVHSETVADGAEWTEALQLDFGFLMPESTRIKAGTQELIARFDLSLEGSFSFWGGEIALEILNVRSGGFDRLGWTDREAPVERVVRREGLLIEDYVAPDGAVAVRFRARAESCGFGPCIDLSLDQVKIELR